MKKVIFFLFVFVNLSFSANLVQAASYNDVAYRRMAVTEVKYIATAVNLESDQFIALLDLSEQRFKDIDAARFYFSDEPDMYDQAVAELNFIYNKELKAVLKPQQYKLVMAMAERQPDLVTLAN